MITIITLVMAGFAAGTLLTAVFACYVFGLLHAEMTRLVDDPSLALAHLMPLRPDRRCGDVEMEVAELGFRSG